MLLMGGSMLATAQDNKYANTYVCTKGKIHFFSATAMEDIEANVANAICVINTETKKVYAKVQQTNFSFKTN
jgi:hypothetical protein